MAGEDEDLMKVLCDGLGPRVAVPRQVLKDNAASLTRLPFSKNYHDERVQYMSLPGVNGEVFKRLVEWLQGHPLPRVRPRFRGHFTLAHTMEGYLGRAPTTIGFTLATFPPSGSTPVPSSTPLCPPEGSLVPASTTMSLFPLLFPVLPNPPVKTDYYQNICCLHIYMRYSPDELRLVDMILTESPRTLRSRKPPSSSDSVNWSLLEFYQHKHPKWKMGGWSQAENRRLDTAIQVGMLELALFAEQYCLDDFFNAIINNFREGERNLERNSPPFEYLDLICSSTRRGRFMPSPTRSLILDYAYFTATAGMCFESLRALFLKYPLFREDFLRRDTDEIVPGLRRDCVTGGFPQKVRKHTVTLDESEGPLGNVPGNYHLHNGGVHIRHPCPDGCKGRT